MSIGQPVLPPDRRDEPLVLSDRYAAETPEPAPFVLDIGAIVELIRSRAVRVLVGAAIGAATGLSIIAFVPPRFAGHALVLVRTSSMDPTQLVRKQIGPLAELMPNALGGTSGEELLTELALMSSRATMGTVVDSLRLQVRTLSPSRVPPLAIVDSVHTTGRFKPIKLTLVPGANTFPNGVVWAKRAADVKLYDREEAIDQLDDRLVVRRSSGNAVEVNYTGRDSVSAAEVPNLLSAVYMLRRKTVDRGLNQRRLEFLTAKADSVRLDLRTSADVWARVATANGAGASAEIAGRALAEEAGALEGRLSELRAAAIALDSLIDGAKTGRMSVRGIVGFPELLKSPALNEMMGQIAKIETERTLALGRSSPTSPSIIAMTEARDSLVNQMLPLAMSYRTSIQHVRISLQKDLDALYERLHILPSQAAAVSKEQAEMTRLGLMNAGMGAQVLDARLAALLEGGDVRVIDSAQPPRRVTFPRPMPTFFISLAAGVMLGLFFTLSGLSRTQVAARLR